MTKMSTKKELAIAIIDTFEDLLDDKNITIPDIYDDDKDEDNNAARIYGETYYNLEEDITNLFSDEIVEKLVDEGAGDTQKLVNSLSKRNDFGLYCVIEEIITERKEENKNDRKRKSK